MAINVGGSGAGLVMQQQQVPLQDISIKTETTSISRDDSPLFWSQLNLSQSDKGFETPVLTVIADTSEQEIVNVSGEGVLTNVISPLPGSSGVVTVRITIDGTVSTFVATTSSVSRLVLGPLYGSDGETGQTNGAGIGSANDAGFATSAKQLLLTPNQVISNLHGTGMKFTQSLKVTVQCDVAFSATSESNESAALYITSIPEGL